MKRWTQGMLALDLQWPREPGEVDSTDRRVALPQEDLEDSAAGRLLKQFGLFKWFLAQCLVCFKHPAYSEEKEWRLIQFGAPPKDLRYRAKAGHVVPYLELNVATERGRLPLRSLIHGPLLDRGMAHRSLSLALQSHGYDGHVMRVTSSEVPFRG